MHCSRLLAGLLLFATPLVAQSGNHRRLTVPGLDAPAPVAPSPKSSAGVKGITEPEEPAHPTPAATNFHDPKYRLSFHVPTGWNFERRDGVLSNFGSTE